MPSLSRYHDTKTQSFIIEITTPYQWSISHFWEGLTHQVLEHHDDKSNPCSRFCERSVLHQADEVRRQTWVGACRRRPWRPPWTPRWGLYHDDDAVKIRLFKHLLHLPLWECGGNEEDYQLVLIWLCSRSKNGHRDTAWCPSTRLGRLTFLTRQDRMISLSPNSDFQCCDKVTRLFSGGFPANPFVPKRQSYQVKPLRMLNI